MQTFMLRPLKKKGQIGLDTVRNVMVSLFILLVIGIAFVLGAVTLRDANLFVAGTPEAQSINDSIRNVTTAFTGFFDDADTIFNILVAVVIILAIGIAIFVVSRFGGAGGSRGGL